MTALQKYAWFNLGVIALTLSTIGLLYPVAGKGALGGFGFLGLMGLGPLFFRKKSGKVMMDERDESIAKRSWNFAFAIFWVVAVMFASLVSTSVYGSEGAVPVWIVQSSVFVGMIVIYAMSSIAILVQYGRGAADGQ